MSELPLAGTFHHAAVVVSDLERSVEFYTRLFGGEVERISGVEGTDVAQLHGLESARFDLAFIRYPNATIELFGFHEPAPSAAVRRLAANEVGAAHLAFRVDDVPAAYERLRAEGVEFSRPPLAVTEGDAAGYVLAFLHDPDGNRVELVAPPPEPAGAERPAIVISLEVSADGRERFLELVREVSDATAAESGAEDWTLHEVGDRPNSFVIYERYRDADALAEHHRQPALERLLADLKPLLSEPPRMTDLQTFAWN